MKRLTPEKARAVADYVRSHWVYDPETGFIRGRAGKRIGTKRRDGALQALAYLPDGATSVLLHRAAWLLHEGEWPEFEVDHEDGHRSNNRWTNLRHATHSQNRQNLSKRSRKGQLRGVTKRGNRWRAQIKVPGMGGPTYLGSFATEEEAHAAYCEAKARHHDFQPEQRDEPLF